jgi:phage shock protein PspC (stress-responsive transcriptional regulator)
MGAVMVTSPLPGGYAPAAALPRRRAYRATDEALIGGVAAGIARHLRLPVMWVRVAFLVAATFGGFGVLVVIDLCEILFTKDLAPFRNNDNVFMWSKGRSGDPTPP